MASLLSDAQKLQASQLIDDLADTFNSTITVINEVANVVINDLNDDFNPFSDRKDTDITYTANSQDIPARIKWLDKAEELQELIFAGGQGSNNGISVPLAQNYGTVRIKTKSEYVDLIMKSTKILVDGQDCQILFNYTPHTLFSQNYAIFYLSRQK